MKYRLSSKLSPRAKKAFLTTKPGQKTSFLLQVRPSKDMKKLKEELEALGGTVRSQMKETNFMTVDMEASQFQQLTKLDGITYIEAGGPYAS